jgi:rhodanese-related sulfurtransferase
MVHKGKGLIIVILIVILALLYTHMPMDNMVYKTTPTLRISIEEARSKRFGLIIDVRTPKERSELGYYPLSIPISMNMLEKEIPLDISNKNTPILIYSNGDSRAEKAAEMVYRMGYHRVSYIDGTYLQLLPGSK